MLLKRCLLLLPLIFASSVQIDFSETTPEDAKIVCYFSSWATYRYGAGRYDVEDIDPELCTHAVYAFAIIDNHTLTIIPDDPYNDLPDDGGLNAYGRFVNLKNKNKDLAVLLAVGGFTESSLIFSIIAAEKHLRARFISSAVDILTKNGFDGLDIDWEYPANNGGLPMDKENFVLLLKEMKEEFDKHSFMLTIAVGMGIEVVESAYDIPNIYEHVDAIHMMTYDFHGSWDHRTDSHTALFDRPGTTGNESYYNVNSSVHLWIDEGTPPSKLVLGIGMYGQTFHVPGCSGEIGELALGAGDAGPYTQSEGMLGYNEICLAVKNGNLDVNRDEYSISPWTCIGNTWVTYDDIISTTAKSEWAKITGLGGGMVWSIDTDDFIGSCGNGPYPLLGAINNVLRNVTPSIETTLSPITSQPSETKVVCYYSSWAYYRNGLGQFEPSDIDGSLCTHVLYCFAALNNETFAIEIMDSNVDIYKEGYETVTGLKNEFPDLKVLISIGGASQKSEYFSNMASTSESRRKFIDSVLAFLEEYSFDGLDLMWEYPANSGGQIEDKENFALLITEMRSEFDQYSYLLSASTGVSQTILSTAYDMRTMAIKLDFINLLTFDYHGSWESETNHHSPLHPMPKDSGDSFYSNIEATVQTWLDEGVPANKLILGYGTYGRSFEVDPEDGGDLGIQSSGGGEAGYYTQQEGFLAYYEICPNLKDWETETNAYVAAPWSYGSGQWVGYDDVSSIRAKTMWAKEIGLGGGLAYSVDTDDFNNICNLGKYPLLNALNEAWLSSATFSTSSQDLMTKSTPLSVTDTSGDNYKLVCYYGSWAQYRSDEAHISADEIDPFICTHLVYTFIGLNDETFDSVEVLDPWGDLPSSDGGNNDGIGKFISLRDTNPDLKLLVAIGGSSQNSSAYSEMVSQPFLRASFINSVVEFINKYGFDGMDFVWVYPANNGGQQEDKENFAKLISEMRIAFDNYGWLLTAAVGMKKDIIESAYDITSLSQNLDFINLMTYDFHDYRDEKTGHHSQMFAMPGDEDLFLNVNASVHLWLEGGANPSKLLLGIPMYSKTFEISDGEGDIGTPSIGPGDSGSVSQEDGFLGYNELCFNIGSRGWTVDRNVYVESPWIYDDELWGGYEDATSIWKKVEWAKILGLGGSMAWSIESDDFTGSCGGEEYTLISSIKNAWEGIPPPTEVTETAPSLTTMTTTRETEESPFYIVCYYGSWAQYRLDEAHISADEIDPFICTHLVYTFIGLNDETFDSIEVLDPWGDLPSSDGGNNDGIGKFISLKNKNPDLKLLVAIGGSSQNSTAYSKMASDSSLRESFIDSAVDFIDKYGFDGMDFVWVYPANNGGEPEDKENFVLLIQEMRKEFDKHGWILSAAVGMKKDVIESAYDIPALSESLHFINLMTYDFHDYRDGKTGHHSQMFAMPDDEDKFLNVNASVHLWLDGGAPREKLILGLPMYSKSFEVPDGEGAIGEASLGPGAEGTISQESGFLGYNELCLNFGEKGWSTDSNPHVVSPWIYGEDLWGGFEDHESVARKVKWAKFLGLRGTMAWSIESDDFNSTCGEEYALISTMRVEWEETEETTTSVSTEYSTTITTLDKTESPEQTTVVDTTEPSNPTTSGGSTESTNPSSTGAPSTTIKDATTTSSTKPTKSDSTTAAPMPTTADITSEPPNLTTKTDTTEPPIPTTRTETTNVPTTTETPIPTTKTETTKDPTTTETPIPTTRTETTNVPTTTETPIPTTKTETTKDPTTTETPIPTTRTETDEPTTSSTKVTTYYTPHRTTKAHTTETSTITVIPDTTPSHPSTKPDKPKTTTPSIQTTQTQPTNSKITTQETTPTGGSTIIKLELRFYQLIFFIILHTTIIQYYII